MTEIERLVGPKRTPGTQLPRRLDQGPKGRASRAGRDDGEEFTPERRAGLLRAMAAAVTQGIYPKNHGPLPVRIRDFFMWMPRACDLGATGRQPRSPRRLPGLASTHGWS